MSIGVSSRVIGLALGHKVKIINKLKIMVEIKNVEIFEYLVKNSARMRKAIKNSVISQKNAMLQAINNNEEFDDEAVASDMNIMDGVDVVVGIQYEYDEWWIAVEFYKNNVSLSFIASKMMDLQYQKEHPEDNTTLEIQIEKMYPTIVGNIALGISWY